MENRLKILGESPRTSANTRVVAQCVCGNIKTYIKGSLRSGVTISCGCAKRDHLIKLHLNHGMCSTRIYKTWEGMIDRCTNTRNPHWDRYGGRDVTVCDRWKDFANFYDDMGDRPEGKELDRIDNQKGYYLENCRWVTRKENMNNRHNSIKVELGYMQLTFTELAELGAASRNTMYGRWYKYKNPWECLFPTTN